MSWRCKTHPVTMRHTHKRSHPEPIVFPLCFKWLLQFWMQLPSTTLLETTMGKSMKWLAAAVLCTSAIGAHAQVNQTRVWAAACASCHGTDGRAQPGMAALAGRTDLQKILLEYKAGTRPATLMHQISKGYTDEQLGQIAAYFAAQKP